MFYTWVWSILRVFYTWDTMHKEMSDTDSVCENQNVLQNVFYGTPLFYARMIHGVWTLGKRLIVACGKGGYSYARYRKEDFLSW